MLYRDDQETYILSVRDFMARGIKLWRYQSLLFVGIILFLSLVSQMSATSPESVKRVLVLNSYHETYHWTDRIMAGVKSVFEPQVDVELYIDYMDTKRSSDRVHFKLLRDLYTHKYAQIKFDAIVSSDDNALNFLLEHRDALFPGVPVFFCGINDFQPKLIAGKADFQGVYESYDVPGTFDLMLKVHPKTKTIVTITDNTVSGHTFLNRIKRAEPQFAGRIKFKDLHDLSLAAIREQLVQLPADALVLWAIYIRTPDGSTISSEASVRMVANASPVPVYCVWDVVGQGVVGGKITSPNYQGQTVAEMASDYLESGQVAGLSVSGSPMVYAFDYESMQQFGILESVLPADRLILNKPYSVYAAYKVKIWATIGIVILLSTTIVCLIYYILKRRQAEQQLALIQQQLAQARKMDAIGQLAGGVAHDFNNMLASICGSAQVLEMNTEPENQKYIQMILSLTDRAAQLTAKLLAFGGQGNVVLTPTNLQRTIESIIDIMKVCLNKAIVIESSWDAPHAIVMADESQITNALLNLGINAEHAMPDGGTLILKTSNTTLDKKMCAASGFNLRPGHYLCIEVSDNGSGIKPELLSKIFDPFFTTRGVGKGSGLGLASVYGSILEHQGAITVHSDIGQGAEFKILLPLTDRSEAADAEVKRDLLGSRQLILVVDDEPLIRSTTCQILTDLNYRVVQAGNGKEALDLFKQRGAEIDLIVMDVVMPVMSGRKAFECIRRIDQQVKVVFTSGFTGDEAINELTTPGHTAFLRKPYRKYDLNHLIVSMLNHRSN
jgi:signal transduction histidine kinase/ActR/RegA family two-component response regulator